jgi:AraC family transcriptional regulator
LTFVIRDTEDQLISQTGCSVLPGASNKASAGDILFMSAPPSRAVRPLYSTSDSGTSKPTSSVSHRYDNVRLRRVLDYISANLTYDITLTDLSKVACLSTFHFARMFTQAFGISPHRYVGRMRLEKAMAEIVAAKLTLAQIALNARFSSQASFTRAFRRAAGVTPGEYRRCRREHGSTNTADRLD